MTANDTEFLQQGHIIRYTKEEIVAFRLQKAESDLQDAKTLAPQVSKTEECISVITSLIYTE